MEQDKVIEFLLKKKETINSLKSLNPKDAGFSRWRESLKNFIYKVFGDKSKEYKDFNRIQFVILRMRLAGTVPVSTTEDQETYSRGLNKAEIFIETLVENIKMFGIDNIDNTEDVPKQTTKPNRQVESSLIQNIYLTQNQVQNISQTIDFDNLDSDIKIKVEELFNELKKQDGKDKNKIGLIIKWLADRAIDVLIAIIAQTKL